MVALLIGWFCRHFDQFHLLVSIGQSSIRRTHSIGTQYSIRQSMIEIVFNFFEHIADQFFIFWYKQDELAQLKRIHKKILRYKKRCEEDYTYFDVVVM